MCTRMKQWRKENPRPKRKRTTPYTPEQRERRRKQAMEHYFRLKEKGLHRESKYRRKAREQGSKIAGDVIRKPKRARCHYCQKPIRGSDIHLDHVFPLSKGGAHASYNLVPACHACNSTKRDKMPNQWTPNGQLEMVLTHA